MLLNNMIFLALCRVLCAWRRRSYEVSISRSFVRRTVGRVLVAHRMAKREFVPPVGYNRLEEGARACLSLVT